MIEINLLPGGRKKKASSREPVDYKAMFTGLSGRVKDKFLVGTVVAVLLAVGATGYLYWSQGKRDTELHDHMDKAERDSTRYANFLKDRYHSEAVRDTLLRQVNIIRGLDEDRYVWPHIMDEISRALPQYTWVTLVAFAGTPQGQNNVVVTPKLPVDTSAAGKKRRPKRLETDIPQDQVQVRVMGRTVDIEALTRFMKDLEASPFLGNVVLDRSEPAVDNQKEVTQFQLTVTYTRPDSSVIHRVPLMLSPSAASARPAGNR